jgi:MFS family permease
MKVVRGEKASAPPIYAALPLLPDSPEDARGFAAVLRRGDFRLLWAAQALGQLADKFLMFALIIVVYDLTKRSTTQSVLMIAYTLPSILFSAPAGVYADRHDKRGLMLATNLLRGMLVLLIPLSQAIPNLRGQAWPLLIVTLLFSSVGQLFAPAEAASIPFLVARPQIMVATSLFTTTMIITLVAGVPVATLSLRLFGDQAPFWIASALFGFATLCVYRMKTSLRAASRAHTPHRHILVELREGAVILGSDSGLRLAMGLLALSLVVVFTMFALGPAYMTTVLGRSPADTYLVLIPATVGLVAMALVLGHFSHRLSRAHALIWSMLAAGLLLIGTGLVPGAVGRAGWNAALVPLAVAFSLTFGIALGGLLIPAFTVLQERTSEDSRGRIFGGIFTVINTSVAIPLLLAGGLADAFGVDRVVAGMGGLLVLGGVVTAGSFRSRLRVLDEHRPQHRLPPDQRPQA